MNNLFGDLPINLPEELVEVLVEGQGVRIERVISTGQASPEGFWFDPRRAEWVAVLKGEAKLLFEGDDEPVAMKPGDYVLIPPTGGTESSGRPDGADRLAGGILRIGGMGADQCFSVSTPIHGYSSFCKST